jgi:glutathione S-transferase
MLETSYAWLDERMATREWATGAAFTLADCAAAPFLFYADWTHPKQWTGV